ncbi:MAG: bifunctional DNA-formamidopyrimidine glycosylase/DNA-(apurinic or apyrimidinic site) lyase [Propionibacteriaceae bacterium]|jgi:formamidopyrimidine-DNA glycosylase|nr:bifunctional DNA-formamidopyrimidine glycosylase/DNA-(apurinic or apyrimidinic site) lyase [Propionibacteriaceae bacterium]
MPELPEVESIRRGLAPLILGRAIGEVAVLCEKSLPIDPLDLEDYVLGAPVVGLRRHAKLLIIDLDTDHSLLIHFKMTGQLVYRGPDPAGDWGGGHPTSSFVKTLPDNTTRVILTLEPSTSGERLFFNDLRKFGWIKVMPTEAVGNLDFVAKLGPEPLDPSGGRLAGAAADQALEEFLSRAHRRPRSVIKAVILDQNVVGGIGNIYADEALWSAMVHPATRTADLSEAQLATIFTEAGEAMLRSLSVGGSTMKTYRLPDGSTGSYLDDFANVFRREGQPCPRCGEAIEKIRVAGRGTHLCPACQPPPD